MSTTSGDMPEMAPGQPSAADLATERAASAAETASQAAQTAAGAVERLSAWIPLLMNRAPQASAKQESHPDVSAAALMRVPDQEHGKQSKGITRNLKRAAATVGQHLNDLSDGRYGLVAPAPKVEEKQERKAEQRQARRARKEAKAEQPDGNVRWFPWMVGMSLGLVIGLVGVTYWQRRRLQSLWKQTSRRMQEATDNMRQRLEAARQQASTIQSGMSSEALYHPLDSDAPANDTLDRQVNGRIESTLP